MASAWGNSWSSAWGNSWGSVGAAVASGMPAAGGISRKRKRRRVVFDEPEKAVDKPVAVHAKQRAREVVRIKVDEARPVEFGLLTPLTITEQKDYMAQLKERHMRALELLRADEDDEEAIFVLMH